MSHPCGDYNTNTLKILKKMEIEIGFRQMMKKKIISLKIIKLISRILK